MTLNEKAIYLKGLAEGLDYDKTTPEGKLIAALIDLVGDMAKALSEIEDDIDYLNDYIEELDEDLGNVERYFYGPADENEDDEDEGCDDECYEIECPNCGETICFDSEDDPDDLTCPSCGEKLATLVEDEDEDGDEE
ncbi:MAG: hypothetical protein GX057_06995 [Clostridiales bacterium]|nr:hypothetical protein [Clostridiales bacterium]